MSRLMSWRSHEIFKNQKRKRWTLTKKGTLWKKKLKKKTKTEYINVLSLNFENLLLMNFIDEFLMAFYYGIIQGHVQGYWLKFQ